jgi:hypothetical protein
MEIAITSRSTSSLIRAAGAARRSACAGRDIDWGRNVVAIRQTVVPLSKTCGTGREGRILPRTKGNKARVIRMDKSTVAVLKTWRARQSQERLLVGAGYQDQDLVFCRPDGKPFHPESFSKTFDRRVRQPAFAELPIVRLHDYADLRVMPTFGQLFLCDGVIALAVSA